MSIGSVLFTRLVVLVHSVDSSASLIERVHTLLGQTIPDPDPWFTLLERDHVFTRSWSVSLPSTLTNQRSVLFCFHQSETTTSILLFKPIRDEYLSISTNQRWVFIYFHQSEMSIVFTCFVDPSDCFKVWSGLANRNWNIVSDWTNFHLLQQHQRSTVFNGSLDYHVGIQFYVISFIFWSCIILCQLYLLTRNGDMTFFCFSKDFGII